MSEELATLPGLPQSVDEGLDDLRSMTTEQLELLLSESIRMTAHGLYQSARAVRILEERGRDLSALRIGIMGFLVLIAHDLLLPEVVVRCGGNRTLIRHLSNLGTAEQRRLLDGGTLRLVVYGDDGKRTHRMISLKELEDEPALFRQVFDRNGYRSEAGQHLFLDGENKKRAAPVAESIGPARLDREAKGVWIGKKFFSLADMKRSVRALEG